MVPDGAEGVAALRSMYLDLLIKSVLGTMYRSADEKANNAIVEGRGGAENNLSLIGWERLINVKELVEAAIKCDIPGDLIETGVWRGGACILMRGILAAYGVVDRCVYLADSFQGVPAPNTAEFPADEQMATLAKTFAVPIDEVKANFKAFGLLDAQVRFVEGWFKDTLRSLADCRFAVIRLDGDLYESTIQALDALSPLLSPGGFVIVDDYGAFEACRRAVDDYRQSHAITVPLQKIDWTGVWWSKPRSA
jgi:O-methyltransferase